MNNKYKLPKVIGNSYVIAGNPEQNGLDVESDGRLEVWEEKIITRKIGKDEITEVLIPRGMNLVETYLEVNGKPFANLSGISEEAKRFLIYQRPLRTHAHINAIPMMIRITGRYNNNNLKSQELVFPLEEDNAEVVSIENFDESGFLSEQRIVKRKNNKEEFIAARNYVNGRLHIINRHFLIPELKFSTKSLEDRLDFHEEGFDFSLSF